MTYFKRLLKRFSRDNRGSAAFDFILVFPAYFMLFLASFESGMLMTRQVMLDRGLDMAVRMVRLNTFNPPTYEQLRTMVCQGSGMIPSCADDLRLEMVRFDPFVNFNMAEIPKCVNRALDVQPAGPYATGTDNEMMFLRACVTYKAFFPTAYFGHTISGPSGEYSLTAAAVYVSEPAV